MRSDASHHRLDRIAQINGSVCAYSVWERPGDAGGGADIILIHGAAANRHWWSHVVPMIGGGRVLAVDLWGHGDSAGRATYTLDDWASEVTEVARQWCTREPYLVGHSVGGLVAVHAAQQDPEGFGGALILDTVLRRTDEAVLLSRRRTSERPPKRFESLESAVTEFVRRHPAAAFVDEALLVEIGTRSHRRVADGWQRAFDPRVFGRPEVSDDFLRTPRIPTMWVRADRGNIDDTMAAQIRSRLGDAGRLVEVAGVGHQLILEQPRLSAALIDTFREWAPTARRVTEYAMTSSDPSRRRLCVPSVAS
jgi:pimeloyl-ACP methyl ester carboxylesterase